MTLTRRDLLKLAGLVTAVAGLSGCSSLGELLAAEPRARAASGEFVGSTEEYRRLARLSYGPTPAERARVAEIGLGAWLEEQLAYQSVSDRRPQLRWRHLDIVSLEANALAARGRREVTQALKRTTLLRRIYSHRQLYEVMVEFWTDHFNISLDKGDGWYLKVVDDREVIRKHALGNFRELLHASAASPAMLVYLDNQANRREAPNENYARELMELHTLGVHGGYDQRDVMELARCLTGWTVKKHFWLGEFRFDPERHDSGEKRVLGRVIPAAGVHEAEEVLDLLATHPSTAQHLAGKLVRRFLTDDPEGQAPELVERAAQAFLASEGDIRALLRVVLYDGLLARSPLPAKFKRPAHFVISALRPLAAASDGGEGVQEVIAQLGQPLFGWPTPDGPPDTAGAWSRALLHRWRFALALARNELPGSELDLDRLLAAAGGGRPAEVMDHLGTLLLGAPLPQVARDDFLRALEQTDAAAEELPALALAGLIASPAFQWT